VLTPYAELHCLTNFSFLRGASHPEELVERARAQGYAALAVTDECSVAGAVRAHLAAKEAELPLVIGSELTLADGMKLVLYAILRKHELRCLEDAPVPLAHRPGTVGPKTGIRMELLARS